MALVKGNVLNMGWLFLRYVIGLFVAAASSMLVFLVLLASSPKPSLTSFVSTVITMAFVGVAVGPFVVPRDSRVVAASLYLVLGILYYVYFQQMISYERVESTPFPLLFLLLAGGLLGVSLHLILMVRRRMTSRTTGERANEI